MKENTLIATVVIVGFLFFMAIFYMANKEEERKQELELKRLEIMQRNN